MLQGSQAKFQRPNLVNTDVGASHSSALMNAVARGPGLFVLFFPSLSSGEASIRLGSPKILDLPSLTRDHVPLWDLVSHL